MIAFGFDRTLGIIGAIIQETEMLTTRLWMGSVLIGLAIGMLVVDQNVVPYPFQAIFQLGLATLGCAELLNLLGGDRPVITPLCFLGLTALNLVPWYAGAGQFRGEAVSIDRLGFVAFGVIAVLHLATFVWAMALFRGPAQSYERMARTWWVVAYLGLLPMFFAQIRWLYPMHSAMGTTGLALAIFVPKGCDIGAYFTGRMFGKHPMTPTLSPKKTWEGAIGGLILAVIVAIGVNRFGSEPALSGTMIELAFGLTVGAAGMLGDLAESLIKRDCQKKDASHVVPGFGGVLDVVDAVIFAAPVAFAWLLFTRPE